MVIVHEDNKPRLQWRLAVVENLIQGNDGHVRAAHIRTNSHKTTRPVAKLYPLEVHSELEDDDTTAEVVANPSQQKTDTPRVREVRAAAARTLQKIKQWSKVLGPAPENIENN